MTSQGHYADTGLDFSIDDFTPQEKDGLLAWYRRTHGTGQLNLVPFAPFLIEHLPVAYKLSRRHQLALPLARDGVQIPDLARVLTFMHAYAALAYAKGVLYELTGARHLGASKALVLDVLGYAYLSAGPRGMNAVAEHSTQFLRDWTDDPAAPPVVWPEGWAADPAIFRSGIDHGTPDLTAAERDLLAAWHERHFGVVPRSVEVFGRLHPRAFKLQRIRYEKAIGSTMPAQLAPLLTLHLATTELQPLVMRQAVHQARFLGVRRHIVVQTIFAGLRQTIDPFVLETVAEAVGDLLAGWEA